MQCELRRYDSDRDCALEATQLAGTVHPKSGVPCFAGALCDDHAITLADGAAAAGLAFLSEPIDRAAGDRSPCFRRADADAAVQAAAVAAQAAARVAP